MAAANLQLRVSAPAKMTITTTDKLTLYTNHRCPWAQRAHIALAELGIPYEQVIIDLDTPRTPEYLAVNPRGLVPTLDWNGQVIIESGVVAQFLADQYPSHLVPVSNDEGGALRRARIALFVDAFISKFQSHIYKLLSAADEQQGKEVADAAVAALVKEVEPLLKDAKPFFGGSSELTLAEVLTGSFVIRLYTLSKANVYPVDITKAIGEQAPNFSRWAEKVIAHPSVNGLFDAKLVIEKTKVQREKALAAKI